jgi:late competence protein required for DNA uptake (superfamily II DNA/RNA helicase)
MLSTAYDRPATAKGGGVYYTPNKILCVRCNASKPLKGGKKRAGMFFCAECSKPKEPKK